MEQIVRTPAVIAGEILILREQAKAAVLTASLEIGKRLMEAKQLVPHGAWGDWLAENVDYSERTAQNLIRIFDEYNKMGRPEAFAALPYAKAVAVLGLPIEAREAFLSEVDAEDMSERELRDAVKEKNEALERVKDLQLKLELLEPEAAEAKQRAKDALAAVEKHNKALTAAIRKCETTEKSLKAAETREAKLVQQLNEAPKSIEAAVVERVPEEVERELERLREIARKAPNEPVIRFRQAFADWSNLMKFLLVCVGDIGQEDAAEGARYRDALTTALKRAMEEAEG